MFDIDLKQEEQFENFAQDPVGFLEGQGFTVGEGLAKELLVIKDQVESLGDLQEILHQKKKSQQAMAGVSVSGG